ncbi:hypothetical protein M3J09_010039 [Ascochyta lentis]
MTAVTTGVQRCEMVEPPTHGWVGRPPRKPQSQNSGRRNAISRLRRLRWQCQAGRKEERANPDVLRDWPSLAHRTATVDRRHWTMLSGRRLFLAQGSRQDVSKSSGTRTGTCSPFRTPYTRMQHCCSH